jgi:hypothetical protein
MPASANAVAMKSAAVLILVPFNVLLCSLVTELS